MSAITEAVGKSGCRYSILEILQERILPKQQFRVYLASAEERKWIIKDIIPSDFDYLLDMYRGLSGCPYLRLNHDTVPNQSLFIFKYCTGTLLDLGHRDLPMKLTKRILKDTLRGLAALHDRDIVHNDIKATNVMMDWEENGHGINLKQVQLTDLEGAVHLPSPHNIRGAMVGNHMWRSPEAHARGTVNKPSDMFSFGVVCIYAVLKRLIFDVKEDEVEEGVGVMSVVLERQISYFADDEGFDALIKHLGDNPLCEAFRILRGGLDDTNPPKPFSRWKNVEADFKDLIAGLTNFDPTKRLKAHEALAHRWFADV